MLQLTRLSRPAITAACLATLAAGCSADVSSPPVATPAESQADGTVSGSQRAQCTVSDPEGELIVHPGSLTVTTTTTLDSVTLIDPVNLEIVEQSVTAFGGNPAVSGIIRDYPPLENAGLVDSLASWDDRRPLPGLVLASTAGQQAVLVALRLVDPRSSGHLSGVSLATQTSAGTSTQDFAQPVLVEPHEALCTIDEVDGTLEWVP